jgi:NAD(P)-dependent dehydrogenase (short-subunit alcohol dehydrogenase family)
VRQVVVTGGGTGIGGAVAAAFAKDGNVVVITGGRPDPLAAAVPTSHGPKRTPSRPSLAAEP